MKDYLYKVKNNIENDEMAKPLLLKELDELNKILKKINGLDDEGNEIINTKEKISNSDIPNNQNSLNSLTRENEVINENGKRKKLIDSLLEIDMKDLKDIHEIGKRGTNISKKIRAEELTGYAKYIDEVIQFINNFFKYVKILIHNV